MPAACQKPSAAARFSQESPSSLGALAIPESQRVGLINLLQRYGRCHPAGIILIPDDPHRAIVPCTARTPTPRPPARGFRGCGRARWLRRPCRPRSGKVLHPPGSARRRRIPLPVEPRVMATGMLALNSAICGGHKRYRTAFCDGTMATACLHRVRRNGQVALTAVPLMLAALPNCNLGRRPGAQGGRATHLFGPINTR